METDALRSLSLRATRRTSHPQSQSKDLEGDGFNGGMWQQDPLKLICGRGFIRLLLVSAIVWMMLILAALGFHLWSCHSSIGFLTALCKKDSNVRVMLDTMGLSPKPQHRCPIPVADDPDAVAIPERTADKIPKSLSYISVDEKASAQSPPIFGGHQSWSEREESFKLNKSMKDYEEVATELEQCRWDDDVASQIKHSCIKTFMGSYYHPWFHPSVSENECINRVLGKKASADGLD